MYVYIYLHHPSPAKFLLFHQEHSSSTKLRQFMSSTYFWKFGMWQGLRVDIGHYHIPKEIMQADPGSNPETNAHLFEAGPAAIGGLRCLLLIASYNR